VNDAVVVAHMRALLVAHARAPWPANIPEGLALAAAGGALTDVPEMIPELSTTAVMVPTALHTYFACEQVLRTQCASARAWVDHLVQLAPTKRSISRRFGRRTGTLEKFIVDSGRHYGEWLRPGENMVAQMTDDSLRPPAEVATAYLSHSARLLADVATVLLAESQRSRL